MMLNKLSRFFLGTLRGRLIISVATVHAVMMTLFIVDLTNRQRAMIMDRQKEEATALAQALATTAAGWIAADDVSGLEELVEAQRRYPGIVFVILADKEGRVLAGTDKSRQGLFMLDLPREAHLTVLSDTPSLVDVAAPAIVGGRLVGWARVGIGQKVAGEKLAGITRSGVVYALAAIFIGSVIAWFMGRRITRRLYAVQETIDEVRSGNSLARSSLAGTDEAAVMAREFNSMLDALAERVMLAELSADIGYSLTTQGDLRSILNACAEALVRHLDVAFARIWTLNVAENVLELQASVGMYTGIDGFHSRVPVGKFKIGLIAEERKPLITNAVIGDPRVHDQEWAKREGMVAFAGHPLTIEDRLVGVMAIFSRNPLTDVTLKALTSVSNEIAIGVERKRAANDLLESEEKYRELVNKIQTAVVVHMADTRISICNPMAQELLGLTEDQLLGKTAVDPAWHFCREDGTVMPPEEYPVNQAIATRQSVRNMILMVHRPDRDDYLWVLVNADPVFGSDGEISQVIVTFVDVTERKQAEETIRKTNRVLTMLSNVNEALIHATEESALLKEVCRIAVESGGYRMAWIGNAENDPDKTILPVAFAGYEAGLFQAIKVSWGDTELGLGPTGTAIRTGKPVFVTDVATDPTFEPWRVEALERGYGSAISVPLSSEDKIFGALILYGSVPNEFEEEEIRLLIEMAGDLSYGITSLRTREERDKGEEELRMREQEYRTLVENNPDSIARLDREGHFLYAGNMEVRAGIPPSKIIGKKIGELESESANPADAESVIEAIRQAWDTDSMKSMEALTPTPEGNRFYVNKFVPEHDSKGEVKSILAFATDITELK